MTHQDELVEVIIEDITASERTSRQHHITQLAMNWPTLAAHLATLMESHGRRPPGAFRHARNNLNQEKK